MKLQYKLIGTALLATVALGMSLPAHADADAKEWQSTGKVKFKEADSEGSSTDESVIVPGGDGSTEIEITDTNPTKGPLKVVAITPLDFGTNEVTAAATGWSYFASLFEASEKGNTANKIKMPNFVQFKDIRSTDNTHTLSAKATTFKTDDNKELKGATITFSNITLAAANGTDEQLNKKAAETTQTLHTTGDTVQFVNQNDKTKGFGIFHLMFGDNTSGDQSVKLNIPVSGNNKLAVDKDYTTTITWTLADLPTGKK